MHVHNHSLYNNLYTILYKLYNHKHHKVYS